MTKLKTIHLPVELSDEVKRIARESMAYSSRDVLRIIVAEFLENKENVHDFIESGKALFLENAKKNKEKRRSK